MTIDEAIAKYNKLANNDRTCYQEEAYQLAEWLEELKDYRDKNKMVVRIDVENIEIVKDRAIELAKEQYNKAIDDFVNACKEDILCQSFGLYVNGIERIAEQLKAGGENE